MMGPGDCKFPTVMSTVILWPAKAFFFFFGHLGFGAVFLGGSLVQQVTGIAAFSALDILVGLDLVGEMYRRGLSCIDPAGTRYPCDRVQSDIDGLQG